MKYPAISRQPQKVYGVTNFNGGINMRDGLSNISDNQLNDALNLCYENGVLKPRPALQPAYDESFRLLRHRESAADRENTKEINTDIVISLNGKHYRLVAVLVPMYNPSNMTAEIETFLVSADDFIALPTMCNKNSIVIFQIKMEKDSNGNNIRNIKNARCFFTQQNNTIYFYNGEEHEIYSYDVSGKQEYWSMVTEKGIYAPLVLTHCKTDGNIYNGIVGGSGTQFEGYNLLYNRYRVIYSTVNPSILNSTVTSHKMVYRLPLKITSNGAEVTATIRQAVAGGTERNVVHKAVFVAGAQMATENSYSTTDGLRMYVSRDGILDFKKNNDGVANFATVSASDYIEDNLEITVSDGNTDGENKVYAMSQCTWFGGASYGLSGGTRLFLCGNDQTSEQNLVIWSDLNKPLYFPENCYAYVGNGGTKVTGFGKQNNALVIFKEDSIYYTQYTQSSSTATADDLIKQTIVDITSSEVYFPLTLINDSIGCDLPDSIQLCRNRLVWADSNGNVYTLMSQNQYSERNVYCVSQMIERKLRADSALKNGRVLSADYDGKYYLFTDNKAYVMDYNSSGFIYAYSHYKVDDANSKIPWWYYEFPIQNCNDSSIYQRIAAIYPIDNELIISRFSSIVTDEDRTSRTYRNAFLDFIKFGDDKTDRLNRFTVADNDISLTPTETEYVIPTMLESKVFDFNAPHYNKCINRINLGIGGNAGEPIKVLYLTENGESDGGIISVSGSGNSVYSSRNVCAVQLFPGIRNNSRFGVRLTCEGYMSLGFFAVNYRITGEAK